MDSLQDLSVREIMTGEPIVATPTQPLQEVVQRMNEANTPVEAPIPQVHKPAA